MVTISNNNGKTINDFFDEKTGLKVKETVENKGTSISTVEFSDYKEISGIKFAFERKTDTGGQTINFKVKEVKVNAGIPDTDFK